jgi:hypothetical protein
MDAALRQRERHPTLPPRFSVRDLNERIVAANRIAGRVRWPLELA